MIHLGQLHYIIGVMLSCVRSKTKPTELLMCLQCFSHLLDFVSSYPRIKHEIVSITDNCSNVRYDCLMLNGPVHFVASNLSICLPFHLAFERDIMTSIFKEFVSNPIRIAFFVQIYF